MLGQMERTLRGALDGRASGPLIGGAGWNEEENAGFEIGGARRESEREYVCRPASPARRTRKCQLSIARLVTTLHSQAVVPAYD